VVLYDRTLARAEGEAWDVDDTTPLLQEADVRPTDDYAELAGAAVVVVTAGATQRLGESRLDLLGRNAGLVREVLGQLDSAAPEAVVLLVSNPVYVLTRLALEVTSRPAHLVFGSGTLLDTARLRYQLGTAFGAAPQDVQVHVIGEHGDSEVAVWSGATIGGVPLAALPAPPGMTLGAVKDACLETTRRRGPAIAERKGYTSYGVAAAVARLVGSVLQDEQRIFTVSVPAAPAYGLPKGAVCGLPCVVGQGGIQRQLVLPLDSTERGLLARSAAILEDAYAAATAPPAASTAPSVVPPPASTR
jgi:L-lactate dehydrogenase